MPLLNIYMQEGKSQDYVNTVRDVIHQTLLDTWHIPEQDCFQLFHEVKSGHFHINQQMWGMARTDNTLVIHMTTSHRTQEMKLAFYNELPKRLGKAIGLSPDDVFISIVSNNREDWSFGRGKAQLLEQD